MLHDHFPDFPVLPGTLIVEAVAQLAGYLLEVTYHRPPELPRRAVLCQIENARFDEPAGPGECLDITCKITSTLDSAARISGEVHSGERRIARVGLTFLMKAIDSERVHEQRRSLYRLWTRGLCPAPPIP